MYIWIVKQSTCFDGEELIFASRVVSISRGEPEAPSAPGDLTPNDKMPLSRKYERAKIFIALCMHLTWFLELWYYQSLVSANDSVCMKPIWEVMQWKFYFAG